MEITVVARAKAKPGCEANLEREFRAVVEPTHREAGCLKYVLHRTAEDPRAFMVFERWTSKAALDEHLATPHIQNLFRNVPPLVEAPPEIVTFELLPEGKSEKGKI